MNKHFLRPQKHLWRFAIVAFLLVWIMGMVIASVFALIPPMTTLLSVAVVALLAVPVLSCAIWLGTMWRQLALNREAVDPAWMWWSHQPVGRRSMQLHHEALRTQYAGQNQVKHPPENSNATRHSFFGERHG